eukprot:g1504.t1
MGRPLGTRDRETWTEMRVLCFLVYSSPVVSFVSSPPVTTVHSGLSAALARKPTDIRAGRKPAGETTHAHHFQRRKKRRTGGTNRGGCCWRGGERDTRQPRGNSFSRRNRSFRSDRPLASSQQDDYFLSGEAQSREEFEAWRAAAEEARRASGGGGSSPSDAGVPIAAVAIEQVYSGRASPAGIDWASLFLTVLDQLLFLGVFAWLATPATRAQVQALFVFRASGFALGALAAVPMFVYGLCLGTRHWPWPKTPQTRLGRGDKQVNFFGIKRQVAKVTAVSVPLAVLVGFCEECVYRGLFPLLLASKTRLPLAAIVGLSAVFCGARHAGTLGGGIDAAVLGVYVHCLLLSTGSILVPIVAHAVFDAILFVAEHVHDTRPQQE